MNDYVNNRIIINGVSYIGAPKNNTIMFVSKKVGNLVLNLKSSNGCVVFAENGLDVPEQILKDNVFVFTDNPQRDYTIFALELEKDRVNRYSLLKYSCKNGYYIGENVTFGKNCKIEPGAFIDHDVVLGENVLIKSGAKIRYGTIIGNDCTVCENSVIGEPGFNVSELSDGKTVLVPSFGRVIIGNNVYIGVGVAISRGSANDTILSDNVKIDSLVRVGHDVFLSEAVELLGSCIVAGYARIGKKTTVATNASVRNRVVIGENCYIGMGSVVQHDIPNNKTVTGNPAITLEQYGKKKYLEAQLKEIVRKKAK